MSKNRFTNSDTKAMVRDIRSELLGKRVSNIYDISDKCYLIKFAVSGVSKKIFLLLESGIRFHTTKYIRDLPELPSPFAMKLRKYIRTKKLEDIQQIGNDRVVDFKYGSGDSMNHLIIELYNNGNIILTDANYEVIALLRTHQFADDINLKVGEIYPISFTTNTFTSNIVTTSNTDAITYTIPISSDVTIDNIAVSNNTNVVSISNQSEDCHDDVTGIKEMNVDVFLLWASNRLQEHQSYHAMNNNNETSISSIPVNNQITEADNKLSTLTTTKKSKKVKEFMMRQMLLSKDCYVSSYGPEILDHCLLSIGIQPDFHVKLLPTIDHSMIMNLLHILKNAKDYTTLLATPGQLGYIIMKNQDEYMEFLPALYIQHKDKLSISYPSFDEAVDEYYCKIEEQKLNKEVNSIEIAAEKKLEKIKKDQEQMRKGLINHQSKMQKSAMLLETYAEDIEKVCIVINSAIDSGMDWEDINDMVKAETLNGNPIASMISKLKLDINHVVLKLTDLYYDVDNDDNEIEDINEEEYQNKLISKQKKHKKDKKNSIDITKVNTINKNTMEIEIDLSLSAYANARNMYSQKKVASAKEVKAIDISEKVLENVETQIKKTLEKQKLKRNLLAIRKVHWFEKFNWCYSSEGYLILSGRDPMQSSILINKYLRSTDIYVHVDNIPDAYPCIVRVKSQNNKVVLDNDNQDNNENDNNIETNTFKAVSPLAIQEAGVITISRSSVWKAKTQGIAAWWVWGKQIVNQSDASNNSNNANRDKIGVLGTTNINRIVGSKHYLAPMPLEMGFGILFRIDESCISKHSKDWKDRNYLYDLETSSVFTENLERYDVSFEDLEISLGIKQEMTILEQIPEDESVEDITRNLSRSNINSNDSYNNNNSGSNDNINNDSDSNNSDKDDNNNNSDIDEINDNDDEEEEETGSNDEVITKYEVSKENKKSQNSSIVKSQNENLKLNTNKSGVNTMTNNNQKRSTKYINKKKARRYANQDEEDRELAMLGIGHASSKTGEKLVDMQLKSIKNNKKKDLEYRQDKAGIKLLQKDNWNDLMALLDISISQRFDEIIKLGLLKVYDIDTHEIKTLASYSIKQGNEIMNLFCEGQNLNKSGNKSGFLAGIMRRYSIDLKKKQQLHDDNEENKNTCNKKDNSIESKDIADIEEELKKEEDPNNRPDELEQFTGIPFMDDLLLYALPVCGAYTSLQHFKYKVKLCPGSGKKRKSGKQAIDVFMHMKECHTLEKGLMQNISENDIVAIMIGDVKLSMPGLYQKNTSQIKKKKN